MGEMADFANEYQEETVNQAHKYVNCEIDINEAFDLGLVDPLGTEQFDESVIDSAVTPWNLDNQLKEQVRILESSTHKQHTCKSSVTENYLSGFRDFYISRGFLSDKQKAIIDTNYRGGSVSFMADIDQE